MGKKSTGTEPLEYDLQEPAHSLSSEDVLQALSTDPESGLTEEAVKTRKSIYGPNQLDEGPGVQPVKILLRQVANAMTLVLIMAMVASFIIKSWIEGGILAFVIGLNIVVGFYQEFSAEKTLNSIRALGSPTARVIRDGESKVIPTGELVPGDIVEIITGSSIPADLRLIEAVNLETDEALLTGESLPVAKESQSTFDPETGAGDRLNMVFSSSVVSKGRAKGVVIAIGMRTEIGKIAAALQGGDSRVRPVKRNAEGKAGVHRYLEAWTLTAGDLVGNFLGINVGTPLHRKLSQLAVFLFFVAVIFAVIVEAANKFSSAQEVVIYAVATGVSMIPASLIVVLTITMSVGMKRMAKRNVLVRKLDSLEALGAVTNICSDKTGTLTQGRMVAKAAWVAGHGTYHVGSSSNPIDPTEGEITFHPGAPVDSKSASQSVVEADDVISGAHVRQQPCTERFMNIASLANVARVLKNAKGEWQTRGDPTEIAIQVFASRFNWNRTRLVGEHDDNKSGEWRPLVEFPFDSDVKRMSVVYEQHIDGSTKRKVFTKGAVERVLPLCTGIQGSGGDSAGPISDDISETISQSVDMLASQGLRVLCLASAEWTRTNVEDYTNLERAEVEKDLTFIGLIGLYDPPRPESEGAVAACGRAGITVHMLTGDHPATASAIAKQVGILPKDTNKLRGDIAEALVMTAAQFDKLSDKEVDELPVLPYVIARCAPQTKVRMIDALHRRKRFVAMTGDGVNDSPSLVKSDVGIAMGQAGSDVAKDVSDLVLTDDNFASILNAIEEGRRIFDNIKRFVLHVLAENIAQAITLLVGLAFKDDEGMSVYPLSPVEIIWVIMATGGLPDMGLGMEVAAPDIMDRPPHDLKTGIFSFELLADMGVYGVLMAALCLSAFSLVMYGFGDGNLGHNCNDAYSAECDLVFRARATTFVCLTWFALFLAWEMVNFRRSFFRQQPRGPGYRWWHVFTNWVEDSRRNPFLLWAIVAGFVTVFPILYIPVINHKVFKHQGITWEWAIVVIETIIFFGGCESWKWAKRVYYRRVARRQTGASDLEEKGASSESVGTPIGDSPTEEKARDEGGDAAGYTTQ
ncbi:sodium transport atpase [Trichodelitschia bisporula]|uniref:P-type Na(+) transporter n=1 Tax=Trichodelitschia bisporula TaxID=703511 RepID=A0A6G1HIQ7_9PEZI|nr:sodium transport atpase [Trichodelitschia bisporula]